MALQRVFPPPTNPAGDGRARNGQVRGCNIVPSAFCKEEANTGGLAVRQSDEETCAIVVYGIVPELMPHRAFRRNKHYQKSDRKSIKCPYCNGDFTEVEATAKLELFRFPIGAKARVKCHKSMPCAACKRMVGIIYAAA